ncbi:RING finger protein 207 isoform X5 [Macaca thibetana thibetana]|uniref:RING finger protein 207 isoform X5 n=1 Tax=Macaca thibetana thibetana TaxID=257877 RepID=UPI0021BCDD75|nr:RING finger protein 207 isoform X5 [Macaca thibetana thibetana]
MSGAIFGPLEGPSSLDAPSVHPLVCPLCHVQYERPCLLDCFHDFCAGCLRGRATEGRLTCPLCQHQTVVKGPSGLPPVDRLLQFLVDSSGDGVEAVRCANCDLECSEQDVETTYFCNTCGQPLCARCRDETHRARMFARHDIVALGQRSRDVPQKCTLHAEPYLLFSTDKKLLLCIRCFRDMQGESRAHCVDLESAYVQGCERLEQAVLVSAGVWRVGAGVWGRAAALASLTPPCPQAVKALQTATREAIALLQAMVEEVRHSAAEEENAIHALFGSMQDRLAERKAVLLQAVQSQYEEKDKAFKEQLSHLATLLPTLQVHLVICSSFLSLATKAEFLDLGYELMERLQGIVTRPYRLRPVRSSKIASDHRAEFARCLEPLLLLGPRRVTAAASGANMLAGGLGPKVLTGPHCPSPVGKMSGSPVQKPTLHRSISTKVLLAEGKNTPFTEHCRHYEDTYRHLQAEMQGLKDQVQELHRDLTKHHSLIKAEIMGDVLSKSLQLDVQIASEHTSLEGMRVVFQEVALPKTLTPVPPVRGHLGYPNTFLFQIWEESYQQVANEQEIYEAQLHDLLQLRQENAYLTTITKQITPYVRSIAKVKERLEPRFQAPVDEQSESLQNTHDDSRNSAASARNNPGSVPEKREKTSEPKGNSWAPNGLSEEPLLKNKDHHRSKQKNRGDIPTWREHLT